MTMQNRAGWLLTVMGGVCLGAAGVGMSQHGTVPVLAPAPVHAPDELSAAFRDAASRVLPSVVSISTETKAKRVSLPGGGRRGPVGPESDLFRQFFGADPRFEGLFEDNGDGGMMPQQSGAGSGFIVDSTSGIVLTNSHVVEGSDNVVVTLHDGREIEAESWKFDPRADVAIIRLKKTTESLPPALVLGDSEQMQVGDWVLAMGNPFQLGNTVTTGIVSATGRGPHINEREQFIQTDAAINPGNSGGPLVNLHGEVIGINTAISTRSGGYDGVGFAIPSKNVRWVADQLIQNGEVRRSYLGVALAPLTRELRSQLSVPQGTGVVIREIFANTPASKAKLQAADVVLEFAGQSIRDVDDLTDRIERSAPGTAYDVKVLRDSKEQTVSVTLEAMPSDYTQAMRRGRPQESILEPESASSTVLNGVGLQLQELDAAMAQQLNLPRDARGVVVTEVQAKSPAFAAGLQPGDVIQRVGRSNVSSIKELEDAVSGADLSQGVAIYYQRGSRSGFTMLKEAQ